MDTDVVLEVHRKLRKISMSDNWKRNKFYDNLISKKVHVSSCFVRQLLN